VADLCLGLPADEEADSCPGLPADKEADFTLDCMHVLTALGFWLIEKQIAALDLLQMKRQTATRGCQQKKSSPLPLL